MCGICGFTQADDASLPTLKAMCDVMAHRGPDGEGQYIDAESGIALGHRRLHGRSRRRHHLAGAAP